MQAPARMRHYHHRDVLVRVLVALLGFVLTSLILKSIDIVLYPDAFPGRVYIDEEGRRYTYEKRTLARP